MGFDKIACSLFVRHAQPQAVEAHNRVVGGLQVGEGPLQSRPQSGQVSRGEMVAGGEGGRTGRRSGRAGGQSPSPALRRPAGCRPFRGAGRDARSGGGGPVKRGRGAGSPPRWAACAQPPRGRRDGPSRSASPAAPPPTPSPAVPAR